MRHFFLFGLLATSFLAHAQQPAAAVPAPVQTHPAAMPKQPKVAVPYKAGAPEQRAEKMSQQLGKELGLDAATVAKVKAAALVRDQKIDAIQTGTDTNKAKNTALQANAQDFKAALKAILTPEQFAKFSTHGKKTSGK
jgi:Spy/CpxP family protein refolding chaperone